jgi:glycine oxidase
MPNSPDAVVVGGGVIGLSAAWRLGQHGVSVTVVDPAPGSGASHAAAGMLAPVTEVHYGEQRALALALAAAKAYPDFVAELQDISGVEIGYRDCGTLAVATDGDDRAVLDDLAAFQGRLGLDVESLTGRECREIEPMLAPGVRGGIRVAGDHQVDNRRLVAALLIAIERTGVAVRRSAANEVTSTCVRLSDDTSIEAATVVVAAGCWSSRLVDVPVRPVKGQILRLHAPTPFISTNVRALVHGSSIYVVPRRGGELVIGATMEEQGYDVTVTAGAVYELLRDAHTVLPGISELALVETYAGLRPGSPDNAPLVGRLDNAVVVATGHGRNGVLLAPVTADAVTGLVTTGHAPDLFAGFGPERFVRSAV